MFNFLKKIKFRFINENKVSKYLLYAIGEIFLVVVGILLALAVNNKNELRKDRAYEFKMLSEVEKSLQKDINDKSFVLNIFKNTENSINELLKMREDKSYPRDSVEIHLDRIERLGLFFPYSDGAFEAIKTSGLDKITNDSIRNELVFLYSYTFRSISIFVNELVRPTMTQKFDLFEKIFPAILIAGQEGNPTRQYSFDNFDEVLNSEAFYELLKLSYNITESINPRLESLIKRMKRVKDLISEEIN